jgi:WD40 repeat protein
VTTSPAGKVGADPIGPPAFGACVVRDSRQFAAQLIGRLLGHGTSNIEPLLKQAAEWKPWPCFRPLNRNLTVPGGPLIPCSKARLASPVSAVVVAADGRRAVSGSWDGTLRFWNLESGRTIRSLEGHTSLVRAVAVTPDGRRAVSGLDDRTLQLWDLEGGQTIRTLEGHTEAVRAMAMTANGRRTASGVG